MTANNRYIGEMILSDIEAGAAGSVKTVLALQLDASGVLSAAASYKKNSRGSVPHESKVCVI